MASNAANIKPVKGKKEPWKIIQESKYKAARATVEEYVAKKAPVFFFTVHSPEHLNKIAFDYQFYNYDGTPYTINYKGIEITCIFVQATYKGNS